MTCTMLYGRAVGMPAVTLLLLTAIGMAGCDLLDATDPTSLDEQDVSNATGADLLRRDALRQLYPAAGRAALGSAIMTDEIAFLPTADFGPRYENALDQRFPNQTDESVAEYGPLRQYYTLWQQVRHAATLALRQLRAYAPEPQRDPHVGQMLAVRGYAALRLGEDFCPGFPLHELSGYTPLYGGPLTTEQVLERAGADLDSAVVLAADSARILNFARVARGRTLLSIGHFADAAAAVTAVPTDYVLNAEYVQFSAPNPFGEMGIPGHGLLSSYSVGDRQGDNGIDFVSANDPRVSTTQYAAAFDGSPIYGADKYADPGAALVLASGVEARLIEAEAALLTDGSWLDILNDLRATLIAPPLEPLEDPGNDDARVDMLFRERALWLFGTGHRLSDLRRLIRQYGRSSETLFPAGAGYGTATRLPFPAVLETPFNSEITGCLGQ